MTFSSCGSTPATVATIYKYVSQDGARKIVANGTLRFGRPADMNDPFDIYIEDLFDTNLETIQQRSIARALDLLERSPDLFASYLGLDPAEVRAIAKLMKAGPPHIKEALIADLGRSHDMELIAARDRMEAQRMEIVTLFKNSGIFCATRNHDNLLMWAHYAQQHRGVVLGFRPDIERDSILAILRPVQYTDARPTFYKPLDSVLETDAEFAETNVRELWEALIYTKSTHWSYEEELRLVIPDEVPDGQAASFLKFNPHELCEIHLGCRVDCEFRSEIIASAKALNKDISIFDAYLEKASYALGFKPAIDAPADTSI